MLITAVTGGSYLFSMNLLMRCDSSYQWLPLIWSLGTIAVAIVTAARDKLTSAAVVGLLLSGIFGGIAIAGMACSA
jgi:hypothetical protein